MFQVRYFYGIDVGRKGDIYHIAFNFLEQGPGWIFESYLTKIVHRALIIHVALGLISMERERGMKLIKPECVYSLHVSVCMVSREEEEKGVRRNLNIWEGT